MVSMRISTSPSVSPPAISSRSRTLGSPASARASSSRLRSSSGSVPACWFAFVREPRELERLHAALVARALRHAPPVGGADEHVLEHAHVRERLGDLEGTADPRAAAVLPREAGDVLVVERDPTRVGPIHAGDQIEQRGLAGAVRPDDAQRFSVVQLHAQVVDDLHAAERLHETGGLEDHGHRCSPPCITSTSSCARAVGHWVESCTGSQYWIGATLPFVGMVTSNGASLACACRRAAARTGTSVPLVHMPPTSTVRQTFGTGFSGAPADHVM